jgi:hypothetical protein
MNVRGIKVKQVNNLHIHEDRNAPEGKRFPVYAPPRLVSGGQRVFLEEFGSFEKAVEWCQGTTDYVHGRGGARR